MRGVDGGPSLAGKPSGRIIDLAASLGNPVTLEIAPNAISTQNARPYRFSLLAGYGWIALSERATRNEMAASWTMLTIGSAVAWLVLLPAHAKQAHDFAMPYVRAADAIGHAATDLVVIDKSGLLFAEDLVRNDPFLRNRPKVLDLTFLDEAKLADLCARYSISMFGRPQGLAFGIAPNDEQTKFDDVVRAKKKAAMARLSCGVDMAVSANKDTRF
jgi:hypothetical protein